MRQEARAALEAYQAMAAQAMAPKRQHASVSRILLESESCEPLQDIKRACKHDRACLGVPACLDQMGAGHARDVKRRCGPDGSDAHAIHTSKRGASVQQTCARRPERPSKHTRQWPPRQWPQSASTPPFHESFWNRNLVNHYKILNVLASMTEPV